MYLLQIRNILLLYVNTWWIQWQAWIIRDIYDIVELEKTFTNASSDQVRNMA